MQSNQFASASLEHYRDEQIRLNALKLNHHWATRSAMDILAGWLAANIRTLRFGICHGSRNLYEVACLRERLAKADVVGTDISPTVEQFGGIVHDFHEQRDEWLQRADFVYSNSWDHARDLPLCIDRWLEQTAPGGCVILHWSPDHVATRLGDCTGATLKELRKIAARNHRVLPSVYAGHNSDRFPRGSRLGKFRDGCEALLGIGAEYFVPIQRR